MPISRDNHITRTVEDVGTLYMQVEDIGWVKLMSD